MTEKRIREFLTFLTRVSTKIHVQSIANRFAHFSLYEVAMLQILLELKVITLVYVCVCVFAMFGYDKRRSNSTECDIREIWEKEFLSQTKRILF